MWSMMIIIIQIEGGRSGAYVYVLHTVQYEKGSHIYHNTKQWQWQGAVQVPNAPASAQTTQLRPRTVPSSCADSGAARQRRAARRSRWARTARTALRANAALRRPTPRYERRRGRTTNNHNLILVLSIEKN